MVDTFLTGFIIMISTSLFNVFTKMFNGVDIWNWNRLLETKKSKIIISGKKVTGG